MHVLEVLGVQEGAQLLPAGRQVPVAVGGTETALIAGCQAGVELGVLWGTQGWAGEKGGEKGGEKRG